MSRNFIPTIPAIVLTVLAGLSWQAPALAQQDLPAAVGRISAVQGQVTLAGDDEPLAATLNWPVTAASHLSTASGARTEFRIGSTAVRLDGDSDLEITELDDDLLRLRLNYGSVSIRVRSPELLRDFELSTPQARITLIEPGLLRVDAERVADTTDVSVLAGTARVDGAGSSLTINAGRHAEVGREDVRTSLARRDNFDIWAEERDRLADTAVVTTRYVSNSVTGYEELERYGSWSNNVDYGPLWAPRNVTVDWAPYRDGRWTWLAPWGWTWVDNAPWGYAPSHYGRWVLVSKRWYWAPGRPAGRPVWAPALVGWVGGVSHPHQGPGLGWFPLSPRERYVPNYRVSSEYERRLSWTHNGKPFAPRPARDDRRDGLTVLPRAQFEGRHIVRVNHNDQFVPRPQHGGQLTPVTPVTPPRPANPGRPGWQDRNGDGRPDRADAQRPGRNNNGRPDHFDTNRPGPDRHGDGRPERIETNRPGGPERHNNGRPDRFEVNRPGVPDRNNDGRADRNDNNRPDRNENNRPDRNDNNYNRPGGPDRNGDARPDRNDQQPGRVIATPAQPGQQNQPAPGNQANPQQPGWQRGPGRSQTINTVPPGQVGTPDAPAQTINPRDVGIELHTRPQGWRPGPGGAVMPAPVLQIGTDRDRFQRHDSEARRDEERRRPERGERPQQFQRNDGQQEGRQEQRPERQERPQPQPRPEMRAEPPQPQARPEMRQERPQPQPRPEMRQERPPAQPRPEARQERAQPAPPQQAQPRAEPRREPDHGGREQRNRQDQR